MLLALVQLPTEAHGSDVPPAALKKGRTISTAFTWLFLLIAVYLLGATIVVAFNPRGWGDRYYERSRKVSRIGKIRMGIFFFSDDPMLFRVSTTLIGLLALGMCLGIFFSRI